MENTQEVSEPEARPGTGKRLNRRRLLTCSLIVETGQHQEQHFTKVGVKMTQARHFFTLIAAGKSKPKQQFHLGKQSVPGAVRRVRLALHHGAAGGAGDQGPRATVSAGVLVPWEPALFSIPCPVVSRGRDKTKRGSSQQPVYESGNFPRNLPHMASPILGGSGMSHPWGSFPVMQ